MDPIVLYAGRDDSDRRPSFVAATFLPARGMNLFQVRAWLPSLGEVDLLCSPSAEEAQLRFGGGAADYMGIQSFSCGAALLLPFANRIRGRLQPDGHTIDTRVLGECVTLPADWHGATPGAEKCAIHGLMLNARMQITSHAKDRVEAHFTAGDFGGHWLSRTTVSFAASLRAREIELTVVARNVGDALLPVGIGWHPYFAVPSGHREQVRVRLPAHARALVDNYDDVFPTGAFEAVSGTRYDFMGENGVALGSHYFDDCFVNFDRNASGHIEIELADPAARYGMRLVATSPRVRAVQLFSRPGDPFVAIEPQFNLADPFSSVWPANVDTGMVVVPPGGHTTWSVRWQLLDG
jgi:aldose 1-epimerase